MKNILIAWLAFLACVVFGLLFFGFFDLDSLPVAAIFWPLWAPLYILFCVVLGVYGAFPFRFFSGVIVVAGFAFFLSRQSGKKQSWRKTILTAYACTVVFSFVLGILFFATGDVVPPLASDFYAEKSKHNAQTVFSDLQRLKEGVLRSFEAGRELPLGALSGDSPVVSDEIMPFMGRVPGKTIVISSDSPLHTIRSPDMNPATLYVGFEKHPKMELNYMRDRGQGFFARLLTRQRRDFSSYENRVRRRLVETVERYDQLFKNAKGEPYDGGDVVLTRCF